MDVTIVIPSRGRPAQTARLLDVIAEKSELATHCVLAVDHDDPSLPDYQQVCRNRANADVAVVAEPSGHVGAINAGVLAAKAWGASPKAFIKLDDDHVPKTSGFDRIMVEELDRIGGGIVYGDDGLQGERLPTAPAISAPVVDALGWMALPSLRHMYCDDVWRELGRAAGCLSYLPRLVISHRHFLNGKAEVDETYMLSNTRERYEQDGAVYGKWLREQLAADAETVRTALAAVAAK